MPQTSASRRSRAGVRRVLTTAALSAVALGAAGAAQAQDLWHSDRRADVLQYDEDHQQGVLAPERASGDIVRVHLVHGEHRISVRVRFTDLRRVTQLTGVVVHVETDAGIRRNVYVLGTGSAQPGRHSVAFMDEQESCQVRQSLSYRDNLIRASFPTSCAGDPRWIRAAVASVTTDDLEDESAYFYLDDGFLGGSFDEQAAASHLSHRVYRG